MRDGNRMAGWQSGSCRGLQILVHRFNSGTGLQILFRLSSAVEQSAVNRSVICSNQIVGARIKSHPCDGIFFGFILSVEQMTEGHRSERLVGENKQKTLANGLVLCAG